ncbi:putative DBINO protein [Hordeum vulgare]|nr:putative DBINO protein [Hordeum vulgare]
MTDAQPNSGGPAIDPPGMAKKQGAKEAAGGVHAGGDRKLDAALAKRGNRRAVVKDNAAARKFAAERDAMEAARRKAEVEEKEVIVNKAHTLIMLGICRPVGFSAAAIGPVSTGSSVARSPHCQSPTSRTTPMSPGFPPRRHDAHTRFSGSPDMSVALVFQKLFFKGGQDGAKGCGCALGARPPLFSEQDRTRLHHRIQTDRTRASVFGIVR